MNIFESIFVLYNEMVYSVSDVIQTYNYRVGLQGGCDYGYSTAVGIFKSVVSFILVTISNKISAKVRGRSIV
jgi:putative aldouronate transport system permease protein